MDQIKRFLEKEKIKYKNISFYISALSHTSYVNENKKNKGSYERLEFLGDAILGKIVSEYIYRNYKTLTPGEMSLMKSKVVSKAFLAKVGKKLALEKYALLGAGDHGSVLSDSLYEDLMESLVAALYLDLGEKFSEQFVHKYICNEISHIDTTNLKDYKTKLQEYFQAERRKAVEYVLVKQKREKDKMIFTINVVNDGLILAKGTGKSKKEAEQLGAKNALEKLIVSNEGEGQ